MSKCVPQKFNFVSLQKIGPILGREGVKGRLNLFENSPVLVDGACPKDSCIALLQKYKNAAAPQHATAAALLQLLLLLLLLLLLANELC